MKPTNPNLTPKQLSILQLINNFQASRCYSPTIAELAQELNVSRTTVFEHIAALREKQLLEKSKGKTRSLRLTSQANLLLDHYDGEQQESTVQGIPLLGKVAAGIPIEAVEDTQTLTLNELFGHSDDLFALEVTGDSMIDEGIDTGDYVICKRAAAANNGQMVVAIVDEENATLKRFYKESDRIRLEASNDSYEPIYSVNCKIAAVVLGHLRRL